MNNNIDIVGASFPLAKLNLKKGESIYIQTGSMIYKDNTLELKTRLNAKSNNFLIKFTKAFFRSLTSGENMFVTEVFAHNDGTIAIAPTVPGQIGILNIDENHQYRLNDGAFLAMEGSANYVMKSQSTGKALFSNTGGFFVMETTGKGSLLINAFGSIEKIHLNGNSITIDNGNVIAWDKNLSYNIHFENNWIQSIGTGEGLVNTFTGTGDIYIQTLNLQQFASEISPLIISPNNK